MNKIAITGVNKQDRMILTQALSYLTGYDIVRQTTYSIQAIKYGWNNELINCNRQELFLYAIASFTERIKTEQQCKQYISNGSVFNELADMEAIVDLFVCGKREKKEQQFMIAGMKRIITEYAVKEYDCTIHIRNDQKSNNISLINIDNKLEELIENCEKVYRINKESVVTDILGKIILNPKVSPQSALERAKQDVVK
ncbi:MAG: hypothetical protein LBB73_04730 [Dysgonamonadaceae bacterium]|nr:hypothetical protein [Dysgonamonadaceae bacterium]